ncbi:discoidin domain-containing protein [Bythopirellula polymerisocia]|nr:discoidin domain-containing protein [Bythopirellula polymerisocia]
MLAGGKARFKQDSDGIHLSISKEQNRKAATVIAIAIDLPALELPLVAGQISLALNKTVTASSTLKEDEEEYGPVKAIDSDPNSYWEADQSEKECWIEIDLGQPKWVGHAMLAQSSEWCPLNSFEILYKKDGQWVSAIKRVGKAPGDPAVLSFTPFQSRYVKVLFSKRAVRLNLCDLQLFAPHTQK